MKQRLIDANALMEYCNNLIDKTIDANDIARFPTAVGWISVKDRLPEKDGKYLVCVGDSGYYKIAAFSTDKTKENTYTERGYGWSDYDCDYGFYEVKRVTHWMPLPEPPKEVSGDD